MTGALALLVLVSAPAEPPTWERRGGTDRFEVFARERPGTDVQEARIVGVLDAEAGAIHAALFDLERFSTFFPFIEASRVLERGDDHVIVYQRSKVPLLAERDYVVRIDQRVERTEGVVYFTVWSPGVSEKAPPMDSTRVRITSIRGEWRLSPAGQGKTRVRYTVFMDPGGSVPKTLANLAGRRGLPSIMEAVEAEAQGRSRR